MVVRVGKTFLQKTSFELKDRWGGRILGSALEQLLDFHQMVESSLPNGKVFWCQGVACCRL